MALAAAVTIGCGTEEEVMFGEPGRVAGGFTSGSGTDIDDCTVDFQCAVRWERDIYEGILDAPFDAEVPTGACGAPDCHNEGAGGLRFPSGNADEAYFQLVAYELVGGRDYVAPCHPELSHIICNLRTENGVANPFIGDDNAFSGGCGSPMPKLSEVVDEEPINQDQLDDLIDWIVCGAPQN